MDMLTEEVERALSAGLYYLAVVFTLTLPDICAALESPNGETNKSKYRAWYDTWLLPSYPGLSGLDLYGMRCGVVHQGRLGHPDMQYDRVLFTVPNTSHTVFHQVVVNRALNLDTVTFCRDMVRAAQQWYAAKQTDPNVIAHLPRLVQYREQGLAPYMVGMPLIA